MKYYVGIDLGTTNSAISLYNGEYTRVIKSPEHQNDVTPSAILIDRRGRKYVGQKAYDNQPLNPDNSAILFKRLMGSSTKIKFASIGEEKTPEECSAEILKTLFCYLPEDIRNEEDEIGTVITIPAAFNQMQKDATVKAANMAGIGKVALMQEPVAAIMSVMQNKKSNGTFIIYDFGGGTLDIAIAESLNGKVNLLSNGGIQMCGGRDIDRAIFDNIIKPWFMDNYDLPDDFMVNKKYKKLIRMANRAAERAKIALSSRPEAHIEFETEPNISDESEEDIDLDITITREDINPFVEEKIKDSVEAVNDAIANAGLSNNDIENIVFIGGPTNYKYLRDRICEELGIKGNTDVNPMTAVAEGASIFAEAIDWQSNDNSRKGSKASTSTEIDNYEITFAYESRTSADNARIIAKIKGNIPDGYEYQIDSIDTGITTGKLKLIDGSSVSVSLNKQGENKFKIFAYDGNGRFIKLKDEIVTIIKTAATISAITVSNSIGVSVLDLSSKTEKIDWLIEKGDTLPKKGRRIFHAAKSLSAGELDSLDFMLWEGHIDSPITDNRHVGSLKITGDDLDEDTTIKEGAELICDYKMLDSGNIELEVTIPSIDGNFKEKNFYSPQDGLVDLSTAQNRICTEIGRLERRLNEIDNSGVDDDRIEATKANLSRAKDLTSEEPDAEKNLEAQERILKVKSQLYNIRKDNLKEMRQLDLNRRINFGRYYNINKYAKPSEIEILDAQIRTAKHSIDKPTNEFEMKMDQIWDLQFEILWRQDWYVIDRFNLARDWSPDMYSDSEKYKILIQKGEKLIENDDIPNLKDVMYDLWGILIADDDPELPRLNISIY